MSSSSQEQSAPGKPAALFSFGSEEPGNQFKSYVLRNADPSNVGRSLLKGNKDHLLNEAKSELVRQEHQVGSLNNCISKQQQQAYAQRLELQDAQDGYIESRREQVRPQSSTRRIMYEGKGSPRYSGPKYARKVRNEELKNYELTKSQCKN